MSDSRPADNTATCRACRG